MIKHIFSKWALFLIIGSTLLSSCGEDGVISTIADTQVTAGKSASSDYHSAQSEADRAMTYADEAMLSAAWQGSSQGAANSYCASFSHDTDANIIILDFGTEGCTGKDGKVRKGKITINYIGVLDATGSNERSISFNGYSVDGNVLNGTMAATRWSLAEGSTTLESNATATSMSLQLASDGTTFSWNGAWKRSIILQPNDFSSAIYTITGGSTGSTREGNDFVATITSPLTYKLSCLQSGFPYAVEGVRSINIVRNIPLLINVNYGDGTCDKEVTISVNGSSSVYTLP